MLIVIARVLAPAAIPCMVRVRYNVIARVLAPAAIPCMVQVQLLSFPHVWDCFARFTRSQ